MCYDITYLTEMSVDELLAFAKCIAKTDLIKTPAGQFYHEEALGWAEFRAKEESNTLVESK